MNRPQCINPPSASTTLDAEVAEAIEKNAPPDEEEVEDKRVDEVDDESEDEDSQDFEADIEANTSTAEEFARMKCGSCQRISPIGEKLCDCSGSAAQRRRLCAVPDCSRYSQGSQYNYMCQHHYHQSTVGEEVATTPNRRRQSANVSQARLKHPYADRKRRDLPRKRSRHHCGSCDACMVDDCGKCRHCLDKPRFGGNWITRQKCMNLPPCYSSRPSASRALDSDFAEAIERNMSSDEEEGGDDSEDEEERKDHLSKALTPGKYEYVPLPTGGAKDVQNEDIVVLFNTGWARGKMIDFDKASPSQKQKAKEFSVPRLVRYVSDSLYWLHDLGNPAIYLSEEQFNNLNAGGTEASERVEAGAWCVVRRIDAQSKPSSRTLHVIGQRMKKFFPGFGECEGVITMLPTEGYPWYRVRYLADDKEEDIHRDDISKYAT